MRKYERAASVITADADGIAQAQTTAGAGDLTLNGAGVSSGVATLSPARRVRIASTGNLSGITFTVYGTDRSGNAITESLAGPNNNTVATNSVFGSVTRVAVSAAVGTNVTVGWNDESITSWIILGQSARNAWTLHAFASAAGTMDFDVEGTSANILRDTRLGLMTGEHPDHLITLAANQVANYMSYNDSPLAAVRLKLNTGTTAPMKLRVQPSQIA